MNDLLCALLAAPPVLVLALMLYAMIDQDEVERMVQRWMARWKGR